MSPDEERALVKVACDMYDRLAVAESAHRLAVESDADPVVLLELLTRRLCAQAAVDVADSELSKAPSYPIRMKDMVPPPKRKT